MNNDREPFDIGIIIAITGLILSGIYFIVRILKFIFRW